MKKAWAVWEAEYPDEGSNLYYAVTEKGALRRWRRETRMRGPLSEHPPLEVAELTAAQVLAREEAST